jgi:glycosyltransferase involved in cell wall biosynthesis
MKYSFIVPVYNRPDEVDELLQSLSRQKTKDFEVIIVEDGSVKPCKDVCDKYAGILDLHYYFKENSGPGQSRNYGAERAHGEWIIVLDSDVVLPDSYLSSVECRMESGEFATAAESSAESVGTEEGDIAAWGGPDCAHPDFTPVQKAISYSMTSFFTTGGIRGGKAKLDKFYPRSFNMGVRREVYSQLGGFSKMRFGEDIDFSYRIVEAGYKTALIPEAWVWHKRRTDFRKFFRQVYHSGIARINLEKRHPGTLKLVHLLPTVFTLGVIALILTSVVGRLLMYYVDNDQWRWLCLLPWAPILLYSLIIFTDSSIRNRSLWVGLLSVPAAFVQLMGYGFGFIESWWKRCVLKRDEDSHSHETEAERQAFEKSFYK